MISGFSSLLPAIEKGAKLKVLCPAGTRVGQCLYSKNPDVKELKDLVGKTVGVGGIGALLHEITVAMLRKHGIDEKQVTFVNIGSSTDIFRACVAGTVDAGSAEIDNYPSAGKYGLHVLTNGKAWEEIPEYTWQAAYTSDNTIATKRDALVRTLAAFGSLYKFLCGPDSFDAYNRGRVAALSAAKNDAAEAQFFWDFVQKYKGFSYDLTLTPQQIEYVQDLNVSLGAQKTKLPIEQIADLSIAKDALKLMGS
jgi:ABC-type nitrate/sulfonate/bicarbonate transport system substrate-binding protein